MNLNRIDKFVNENPVLLFLVLIMTFGLLEWLLIWLCYEIVMSVLIDYKAKKQKEEIFKERK
jgi:hypothetical protein